MDDLESVYVWADGIYVKAGREKDNAAMLVLIAALRDGRKVVLAVESGYRESTESWASLLRDLKARGLRALCLRLPASDNARLRQVHAAHGRGDRRGRGPMLGPGSSHVNFLADLAYQTLPAFSSAGAGAMIAHFHGAGWADRPSLFPMRPGAVQSGQLSA